MHHSHLLTQQRRKCHHKSPFLQYKKGEQWTRSVVVPCINSSTASCETKRSNLAQKAENPPSVTSCDQEDAFNAICSSLEAPAPRAETKLLVYQSCAPQGCSSSWLCQAPGTAPFTEISAQKELWDAPG